MSHLGIVLRMRLVCGVTDGEIIGHVRQALGGCGVHERSLGRWEVDVYGGLIEQVLISREEVGGGGEGLRVDLVPVRGVSERIGEGNCYTGEAWMVGFGEALRRAGGGGGGGVGEGGRGR